MKDYGAAGAVGNLHTCPSFRGLLINSQEHLSKFSNRIPNALENK